MVCQTGDTWMMGGFGISYIIKFENLYQNTIDIRQRAFLTVITSPKLQNYYPARNKRRTSCYEIKYYRFVKNWYLNVKILMRATMFVLRSSYFQYNVLLNIWPASYNELGKCFGQDFVSFLQMNTRQTQKGKKDFIIS